MQSTIHVASELVRHAAHVVALTGAGISTPSGIPDFRTPRTGTWSLVDPLEVASIWAFHDRPQEFYRWFAPLLQRMLPARPNSAHLVLAAMQAQGVLASIITQNIDSLHQLAGSRLVYEVHGHTRTATCLACGETVPSSPLWPEVIAGGPPPRCASCGGLLKPDVVLFGEPLPYDVFREAQQEALRCDVLLIIGTSLEVMPAADLPLLARRRGAKLVLINRSPTPLDGQVDVLIRGDVARAMEQIWRRIAPRN